MKGMQKNAMRNQMAASGAGGGNDLESTGFEVQPVQVLMGTIGFIFLVIMMHFFSKVTA